MYPTHIAHIDFDVRHGFDFDAPQISHRPHAKNTLQRPQHTNNTLEQFNNNETTAWL